MTAYASGYRCERCGDPTDAPAAHAMSHELRENCWGYLRELQWERPSAGGVVLSMPPCFRSSFATGGQS